MLKPSDLTVSERGKLAPGLQVALRTAMELRANPLPWISGGSVRDLDARGLLDIDLWIEKTDGTRWFLRERNFPTSWKLDHWIDFVVKLAKQPYVTQVGIMKEIPLIGVPILPSGNPEEVYSPQALINVAARPPEPTVTPEPEPNPYQGGGGTGGGNGGGTGGSGTGGGSGGGTGGGSTGGGNWGGYQGVAGWTGNPTLWFGVLAGGSLLLILLLGRHPRHRHEYEPDVYDLEEED